MIAVPIEDEHGERGPEEAYFTQTNTSQLDERVNAKATNELVHEQQGLVGQETVKHH